MAVLQERYGQPGEMLITVFILTSTHEGEHHGKGLFSITKTTMLAAVAAFSF